jgi:hypothetical protein
VLDLSGVSRADMPIHHERAVVEPPDEEAVWASVLTLPEDVLQKLRKAVGAARMDEVTALIAVIASTHPGLAEHLSDLAHRFDYVAMRNVLRA